MQGGRFCAGCGAAAGAGPAGAAAGAGAGAVGAMAAAFPEKPQVASAPSAPAPSTAATFLAVFGSRDAAVSAGYKLAIKGGSSAEDAACYAQSFADAAVKNCSAPTGAKSAFRSRDAAVSAGYKLAIKGGSSAKDAACYAQSFADTAVKNGSAPAGANPADGFQYNNQAAAFASAANGNVAMVSGVGDGEEEVEAPPAYSPLPM